MLRRMPADESPHLDDQFTQGADSDRSMWWAMHRPETYALAALVLAVTALFSFGPGRLLSEIFFINGDHGIRAPLATGAGIDAGLALVAFGLALASIRAEDEDATWSPPVARAALVVGGIAAAFQIVALIVLAVTTPDVPGFTSPSP
jgi:hypothetical protein